MAERYKVPESSMVTHLIEDRRASLSPWGKGNSKLGQTIYCYSKLPVVTCPGASAECLAICYARKIESTNRDLWNLWKSNTERGDVLPPLPADAKVVRFHVSGDFDTVGYIASWAELAFSRPDVRFFGYTRSWRCPDLLPHLKVLERLPNVDVWASVDQSIGILPPPDFRRAWIEGDTRLTKLTDKTYQTFDGQKAVVCPEESGYMPNCQTCQLCFREHVMDLVFLKH